MFLAILKFMFAMSSVMAFAGTPTPGDPDHPTQPTPTVQLDSRYEGMYALTVTCNPRPEDCNSAVMQMLDRISIVDSRSAFGVWITLGSCNTGDVLQSFYSSVVGPSPYELNAQPRLGSRPGRFSQIQVVIDPATGMLSGELFDVRTRGTLVLHGKPLVLVGELASRTGGKLDELLGEFSGSLAGGPGTFMIRVTPLGRIVGFFASDKTDLGVPVFTLDFSTGFFDEATGVLHLVNDNPRFGNVGELALVREGSVLRGIYFNAFVDSRAELTHRLSGEP